MVNGCDEGGAGVWGGLVQDEYVDIPLMSIDASATMGTLRDLVGTMGTMGDLTGAAYDDVDLESEDRDGDELGTRATRPWGEDLE